MIWDFWFAMCGRHQDNRLVETYHKWGIDIAVKLIKLCPVIKEDKIIAQRSFLSIFRKKALKNIYILYLCYRFVNVKR